jgi:hypothetical protein
MKVIAFLAEHALADRIIEHLGLTFVADKPPPSNVAFQEYFSGRRELGRIFLVIFSLPGRGGPSDFRLIGYRARLPGFPFAHSRRPDMFRAADLCFLTMVGWDHRGAMVPAGRRCRKAISP